MKSVWVLFLTVVLASCGEAPKQPEIQYPEDATVLTVKGMHCSGCKAAVMRELAKIDGVEWARIEPELEQVAFSGPATKTEVVAAIEEAGYDVTD